MVAVYECWKIARHLCSVVVGCRDRRRSGLPRRLALFDGPSFALALLVMVAGIVAAGGFTPTSLTYNGRLVEGGLPANGSYEFRLSLHDDPSAGDIIGLVQTNRDVTVSNGLFAITVDLGSNAFTGDVRWLEVGVRTNGGLEDFTTLSPRQILKPVPLALVAQQALSAPASGLAGLVPSTNLGGIYGEALVFTNLNNFYSGNGAGLTDLNASALAGGTVPDVRLSTNVATVSSVAAQIAATNANTVVFGGNVVATNGETSLGRLVFSGDNSMFTGHIFNFWRPGPNAANEMRWYTAGDEINYFAMGPDFASKGDFFVLAFLGKDQKDLFSFGMTGETKGNFAIGGDPIEPDVQFLIHDWDPKISYTIRTYSYTNGIYFKSRQRRSDGLVLSKDDDSNVAWLCWSQGDTRADWRMGMLPHDERGQYDFGLYNARDAVSSAVAPGEEYARFYRATGNLSIRGQYLGDGGGLTNLLASGLAGGTVPDARLSTNVALLGGSASFAGNLSSGADLVGRRLIVGTNQTCSGADSAVTGGANNSNLADQAVIAGGSSNLIAATAAAAVIGGGSLNTNLGVAATIPGGWMNQAAGDYSFAGGHQAGAMHAGAFVWADSQTSTVASVSADSFTVRARGGVWLGTDSAPSLPEGRFLNTSTGGFLSAGGLWTSSSDRDKMEQFLPVNPQAILDQVLGLPLTTWSFRAEDAAVRHLGPIAQDFYAAFGLGADDRHIAALDASGVALAAIQGMNKKLEVQLQARDARIAELERRLSALEEFIAQR